MKFYFIVIQFMFYLNSDKCCAHIVRQNDLIKSKDTDLLAMAANNDQKPTLLNTIISKLKYYLNPINCLRKFFEMIPEIGFWILGINDNECRYLSVCETSNFIINNFPETILSIIRPYVSSNGFISKIIGETPYMEAWSLGTIKLMECNILYNCSEHPFGISFDKYRKY